MSILRLSTGETLSKYCRRNGICYGSIWNRIDKGWGVEEAISTPLLQKNGARYFINGKSAYSQLTKNQYQMWLKQQHKKGL